MTALLGPSGCGKTTLLRLLNKLVSPDSGRIFYKGVDIAEVPSVEHRRRVMMLSQNPVLFPGNIRDNLEVGFRLQKTEAPGEVRLREILSQVRLDKDLDGPCEQLSGGERQRLVLARVCLLDPEVYLLDEPSAALDEAGVASAALESLAESFNDGVVAPLFWFLLATPVAALGYYILRLAAYEGGDDTRRLANHWLVLADWIPTRLLALSFALAGNFTATWEVIRERLLKPYIGQCLGVSQLNELLKVITDYYLGKGRVTSRAYLPQQDLSTGHLQVLVVEGKVSVSPQVTR